MIAKNRQWTAADTRRSAIEFFAKYASCVTPPGRMGTAKKLADAEAYAAEQGWEYLITDDDERAYCYCDDPKCKYHEGSDHDWETIAIILYRPCPTHGSPVSTPRYSRVFPGSWIQTRSTSG